MNTETTNDTAALETALELRFRRLWKADFANAHHGNIQDTLVEVERLLKNSERRIEQAILSALENKIAAIVVKILAEYRVRGGDGQPIRYSDDK